MVYGVQIAGPRQDVQAKLIMLAKNEYNPYAGTYEERVDAVSNWEPYEGQRVCVAASDFSQGDGVSITNYPTPQLPAQLLYVEEN